MYRINVILFFMLVLNQLFGQLGGTSTFSFLELTNSARLAALGGKNISNPDKDLSFVHDNPALLDSAMSNHLVLNYVNYFAGLRPTAEAVVFESERITYLQLNRDVEDCVRCWHPAYKRVTGWQCCARPGRSF